MSIEEFEKLSGRYELYQAIDKGLNDVRCGKTEKCSEVIKDLERKYAE